MSVPANFLSRARSADSAAGRFWDLIRQEIQEMTGAEPRYPRLSTLVIPIAGLTPTPVGWISSVGIAANCRIAGYQIFALVLGQVTIDLQRSTPVTHPAATFDPQPLQFPSMVTDGVTGGELPSLDGAYADNLDTSPWLSRDLSIGDMIHAYITATDGIAAMVSMILYLQDLDERT